jgi:hypothetical protein|tara:strand:- start:271 stop:495 length:225 start_codon:yes stop_codon:yes gene_type:complete
MVKKSNVSFAVQKKPIEEAFSRIAELKVMLRKSNDIQKQMLTIILQLQTKIDKLQDFKEKEVIDKEKARQGWFY